MKKLTIFLLMSTLVFLLSCSMEDDSDNATLSGNVYWSPNNKVGMKDVIVMVEGTSQYNFNEQTTTDNKGHWSVSVFLGSSPVQSGSEGGVVKHEYNYQMDVDVTFFYPDYATQIGQITGLTLTAGEDFVIEDIYYTQ